MDHFTEVYETMLGFLEPEAQIPGVENAFAQGQVCARAYEEIVISNFKTFLKGTYHGRCINLQSYMDEFDFRFNRRMTGNQMFMRLTRAVATSCALLC